MEIISYKDIATDVWDEFCEASPDAWLRHTSTYINFSLSLGESAANESFAVVDHGKMVAIVPLQSEFISGTNKREYAMGGMASTPFAAFEKDISAKDRKQVTACIFEEIDRRAKEAGISYARIFLDPLTDSVIKGQVHGNPFLHFGYFDTSIETVMIDLRKDEQDIFADIAKGHRSDIHFAQKQDYQVDMFGAGVLSDELCEAYKQIYFAAAGREVGSPERWHQIFQQVKDGHGILALARLKDYREYQAGNIVSVYKLRAYNAVSAVHPDSKHSRGLGHLLQWEIIVDLKRHGYTHYEIGWRWPPTISEVVYSKKQLDISHFKSLFGGEILPVFKGEKYYDMEYLRERRALLTEQYITQYGNEKDINK